MPAFSIALNPADYLAFNHQYALRNSVDGWATDLAPTDTTGLPRWSLDHDRYGTGFECKFVIVRADADRSQDLWMLGDNLRLTPSPDATYSFAAEHAGPIAFPFFVRLVGTRFADASITVRDQTNGLADRTGWYDSGAWWFEIPWTDYYDSSEGGPRAMRYKFVKDGAWMAGPNLQIGPDHVYDPGEFARVGQIYDTNDTDVSF